VTVQAPSDPSGGRGSAAWERRNQADSRARSASADEERWERRKTVSIADDVAAREAAKTRYGSLGFMRLVLLIAFLLGILIIGRQTLAVGRSGNS
jgi:hypothetical protein